MTDIKNLINLTENDWLDFKAEWHANTADLIFDILCLTNSDAKQDRYLVIGFDEKTKTIQPLTDNRKTHENLFDLLSKAKFNRIPTIDLQTIQIDNQELDIITIKKTNYRPYFLTDNKQRGKTLVRAGVVYTRNGPVNTPIDSSASENQIADMWRERFGLTLSPMERVQIYIQDTDNWKLVDNPLENKEIFQYYYAPFPEFTIDFGYGSLHGNFSKDQQGNIIHASHCCGKTIGNSEESCYVVKYLSTILTSGDFLFMDNHRNMLVAPDIRFIWYDNKNPCREVHIETEKSFITDTGCDRSLEKIKNNVSACKRACFCYHVESSFKHGLQKILDNTIYSKPHLFDPYDDEDIATQIYLIPSEEQITSFARTEALSLLKLNTDPNPPTV